ncbi:MAG: hypothetical protein QOJ52_4445, partial [Acidimicrobiaceae bacterium]|nr:hypothetical protein [Acidimicrobiaceae bacterium]
HRRLRCTAQSDDDGARPYLWGRSAHEPHHPPVAPPAQLAEAR